MPAILELQDTVDVPEPPVIVPTVRVHDMFVELVVTARETDAVNPLSGKTLIPELPITLALTVTLV